MWNTVSHAMVAGLLWWFTVIERDELWRAVCFVRNKSKWTGNRFELVVGGSNFTLQRRGRRYLEGGLKRKADDTYFARGDHGWVIIVRGFDFRRMSMPSKTYRPSVFSSASPEGTPEIPNDFRVFDFQGDYGLFQHDYVMFKLFEDSV